jgi:hypothetical protein
MHKTKPHCTDESWHGRADCRHCAIRSTVLFSILSEAELDRALLEIDNQCFESGSEVFSQDANDGYVYTVRVGCLKMVTSWRTAAAASCACISRRRRWPRTLWPTLPAFCLSHAKADICASRSASQALELKNPHPMSNRCWQSLDEAESFITDLNTGHAERRLAKLLLKLATHSERNGFPDLLRDDIAAIIGVTTETASRLMADFRHQTDRG